MLFGLFRDKIVRVQEGVFDELAEDQPRHGSQVTEV